MVIEHYLNVDGFHKSGVQKKMYIGPKRGLRPKRSRDLLEAGLTREC